MWLRKRTPAWVAGMVGPHDVLEKRIEGMRIGVAKILWAFHPLFLVVGEALSAGKYLKMHKIRKGPIEVFVSAAFAIPARRSYLGRR